MKALITKDLRENVTQTKQRWAANSEIFWNTKLTPVAKQQFADALVAFQDMVCVSACKYGLVSHHQVYAEVMGKLSRNRLYMEGVLNSLPNGERNELKERLRIDIPHRATIASHLAIRKLKHQVLPTDAQLQRAKATLEKWYLA